MGTSSQKGQEGSVGTVSKFGCEIISMWAAVFSDSPPNLPTAFCDLDHDPADVPSTTSSVIWTKLS